VQVEWRECPILSHDKGRRTRFYVVYLTSHGEIFRLSRRMTSHASGFAEGKILLEFRLKEQVEDVDALAGELAHSLARGLKAENVACIVNKKSSKVREM